MTRHYTSREFNQDTARAKRDAREGPVFITDRGVPAHVLLTYDEYRRLLGGRPEIADLLASADDVEIDFQADRKNGLPSRMVEFD